MLVSVMVSSKLTLLKDLRDSLSDGYQPLLDTLHKDSVNSVSMKSSRMSTEMLLERMSQNTELLVLLFHLHALSSLLISFSAHGKPLRLECKHLSQENSPRVVLLDSNIFLKMRVQQDSIEVSNHSG